MLVGLREVGLCGDEALEVGDGESRRQIEGEDVLLEGVAGSNDGNGDARPLIAESPLAIWSLVVQVYSHSCLFGASPCFRVRARGCKTPNSATWMRNEGSGRDTESDGDRLKFCVIL